MSFGTTNDDYNNDIKPDNSCSQLTDSISSISWATNMGPIFAASTWDGFLKIYEVANNGYSSCLLQKISIKAKSPLTQCLFSPDNKFVYVGDVTGSIQAFDVGSSTFFDIGKQNASISTLQMIPAQNVIVSGAYQNNLQFWQPGNSQPVYTIDMTQKILASDFSNPILVASLANQKLAIIDINTLGQKTIVDSADLGKHSQIQSLAINSKANTVGLSTFDGRSNITGITKSPNGGFVQKAIITFKSHKQEEGGSTILYPVNSVAFSPVSQKWFMTAGSDGMMHFWDYEVRNKIKSLNFAGTPICHAKVSPMGDMIAYGLGNDWHIGAQGSKWPPRIGVHRLTQQEMKFPKAS